MALSVDQIAQMSRLLDGALELDREGRRRWLEALSTEYRDLEPALRRALLGDGSDAARVEPLRTLPKIGGNDSAPAAGSPKSGERIGPYELIRLLGTGGMAQVWLARRADGAYEREVALKLPVALHVREEMAQRFARERDILAALEHPHVARFYDAGISQDGRPYLALEYVDGRSLIAWADERLLGIDERIELFLQVLDAVQYAHGKGVLHRDLKPSNTLVTKDGQVRLLDFGVARLLERDTKENLTEVYGKALTPEYASPEQINGDELQPASDVYSLGVVLHELLCGARPTRFRDAATPVRPSTRISKQAAGTRGDSPTRLAQALRGDLDAIVTKALALESSLRYDSAASLAEDLRRYVAGRPVQARGGAGAYRAAKFVRRHRVTLTVAALACVGSAALGSYVIFREAATISAVPNAAAPPVEKSLAVLPFVDMSEKHDQEYFSDGLTEELIDRLARSPDLKVIARTSSFAFKGRSEDVRSIGAKLGATNLVEGSVRRSDGVLRITVQLIRASDGVQLWSQSYDRDLRDVFKVQDEVAEIVAKKLGSAMGSAQSMRPPSDNVEAYNLVLQGKYFRERTTKEDSARAQGFFEKAIDLDPKYARAWTEIATLYLERGNSGWMSTPLASKKARNALDHALALDPELAEAHRILGWVFMAFDWDWGAAREQFRRAHDLDPNDLLPLEDLANINSGIYGDSSETTEVDRKILARDPLNATAWSNLALDLIYSHQYKEALDAAHQLLTLSPAFSGAHSFEGQSLFHMGRLNEALTAEQSESDEALRSAWLGVIYWALGRRQESDAALKTLEEKYADAAFYDVGIVRAYRGETDRAFEAIDRAFRERNFEMLYIRSEPLLANIRNDTRYHDLLVRMRLDDASRPGIR